MFSPALFTILCASSFLTRRMLVVYSAVSVILHERLAENNTDLNSISIARPHISEFVHCTI